MNIVLDVSKHQGDINFDIMKSRGIDSVMCRCAYSGYKDSRFDEYCKNAQSAGIAVGAYAFCTWHYSSFSVNGASAMIAAESEANKVIAILQGKKIAGPVAIDLELESERFTLLTRDEMTSVANRYLKKLEDAGYRPILYCSISWLFEKLNYSNIKYPIWVAYYNESGKAGTNFPATKYGELMESVKDKIFMWQYSSHGDAKSFGASSERIDLNHCYTDFCTQSTVSPYDELNKKRYFIYTVRKGDTLYGIAQKYGVTLHSIIADNPQIKNPNLIFIGQRIKIFLTAKKHKESAQENIGDIYVGCTVKLKNGAKTFDGKSLASFVFLNTYTVDQIKGNRAVLDIKGICTPVNTADLIRVNL